MAIQSAAVIGAGVMGSGIAAHIANAGVKVVLLDIVKPGSNDRSAIARGAVERMAKTDPAPLMAERNARLITPGNLEDDLGLVAGCDLIIEAVLERLDVKQDLYRKLEAVRKNGSIVASNTSTIPLRLLTGGMPERFRRDFVITHFFNPPRYMRLLELVAGPETRAEAVAEASQFFDHRLGKGVVLCKDRPGFIANRIGAFWMQNAINVAMELGLTVEEADAVMGRPLGIPKTGVFALIDLVGLDLMPHVGRSLMQNLPEGDAYRAIYREHALLRSMVERGLTGRKGKGGFQRINREAGKRKETMDLRTGEYRPEIKPDLDSIKARRPGDLLGFPDKGGEFARAAMVPALVYAAGLVPEIADSIQSVDEAMRLGFGWRWGPFELIDQIGADKVAAFAEAAKLPIPPLLAAARGRSFYRVEAGKLECLGPDGASKPVRRPDGVLLLEDIKRASQPLATNPSASLWDVGDGVACLEFHSKSNTLDAEIMALLQKAIGIVSKGMKGLVIYNEGGNFSLGANIGIALFAANIGLWPAVEEGQAAGQATYKALKFAPFPTVAAPAAMALGGGCEICLHTSAIQAHAELYMGLVEAGVGILPGWGGCKELLLRLSERKMPGGPMPPAATAFETISTAQVSRSAEQARALDFLRPSDGITMNRDRLLADAKARVLALAEGYQPPAPVTLRLPGPSAAAGFAMAVRDFVRSGKATEYDAVVAGEIGRVLSGGDTDVTEETTEDRLLELERESFRKLIRNEKTLARIEHTLETGKPLRN
ncbi:MAG TPA: 3-hydroxyacyl-CoA dehydrogenase NAD-binding domain-containing protein [Stellaceae bacterium]|nr:3-hydroxyacyl-CoA dehydrogenase NAD-binding domain-containing protein [Stellaceae bacterium]